MAGYSGTPLQKKLGVKPGQTVFLDAAPASLVLDVPVVRRLPRSVDLTVTFHTVAAQLERRLPTLIERTTPAGAIWVCWPKQAAARAQGIATDLDGNRVRELGLAAGVVDVKVCAIDETWSGLRFVRRLADRG